MKRFFSFVIAAALALAPASAQSPQVRALLLGVGKPAGGVVGFQGPLDVIASASACYSLRACSAALRGAAAVNVCNSTGGADVGCGDLMTDATTGNLVSATIGGITCPGANCTIRTWYDQTAGNACGGATCDLGPNSTVAARPTLAASVLGSFPAGQFDTTKKSAASLNSLAMTQPFSLSAVARRTTVSTLGQIMGSTGAPGLFFDGSGTLALFNGATSNFGAGSVTENAFHNVQGFFSASASSSIGQADATQTTGLNPGSTGITFPAIGNGSFTATQDVVEAIFWSGDKSASFTALCHNQFAYWGTSVSC